MNEEVHSCFEPTEHGALDCLEWSEMEGTTEGNAIVLLDDSDDDSVVSDDCSVVTIIYDAPEIRCHAKPKVVEQVSPTLKRLAPYNTPGKRSEQPKAGGRVSRLQNRSNACTKRLKLEPETPVLVKKQIRELKRLAAHNNLPASKGDKTTAVRSRLRNRNKHIT